MLDIKLEKKLPVVQMNFEEVKTSLIAGVAKYKNIIVTEDNLKDCKGMQKELSKSRNDLETYRKGIKKEMLIPVTKFEGQCKELVGLIDDNLNPIKDSILVFDNEAKEKKKLIALEHINKVTIDLPLNEKYSTQLTVLDEYMNASMSIKKLKEDIEKRGCLLKQEQQQEAENLQIIKDTIENCNKNIDAKLDIKDFQMMINANESISIILHTINERAERIKTNELKAIADNKAKAEHEVLERIAKAEREAAEKARVEERNARIAKEGIEETERLRLKAIEDSKEYAERLRIKAISDAKLEREYQERQRAGIEAEILAPNTDTKQMREVEFDKQIVKKTVAQEKVKIYFIEMRVEGNIEEVDVLSKFLKENNYNYKATAKGELK
ncbi:DUF1351 domain-containing protein (plasmid) [Clostridium estertheticum]|uniref:DUF1351 domain-containing protein n=1 Tax=Clostridium estertheticum TaxID=238834 RepID=UPI001C7DD6E7|nr:DUF1351 domain-containing protein [Clostridium estertheticum]MBX4259783.1 DUF1351 domain-containing protein [Clostridium estertheticum]WLC73275.1 DUF1351 domain-containing protein [Clostridium estertheticum]